MKSHFLHDLTKTAGLFAVLVLTMPVWGAGGKSIFYTGDTQYVKPYSSGWTGYTNPKKTLPIPPTDDASSSPENSIASMSNPAETAQFFQTTAQNENPSSLYAAPLTEYGSLNDDTPQSFFLEESPDRDSLFQGIAASMEYIPNTGTNNSGMTSLAGSVTLGIPLPDKKHPLLLVPDIKWNDFFLPQEMIPHTGEKTGLYSLGGSIQYLFPMNDRVMIKPQVDLHWNSDLTANSSDALRITGGAAVLVKMGFHSRLILGAYYFGVSTWSVVPVAGIMYRPSDDWIFDLYFPRPKISRRMTCFKDSRGETPYWGYISGELYGDKWLFASHNTIERNDYKMSYYDYRLFAGMERKTGDELNWAIEGGLVFGRKCVLDSKGTAPSSRYYPDTTGVVRLKVTY